MSETKVIVRQVCPDDVNVCAAIESACFPASEAASYEKIAKRAQVYPDGFLVAERSGEVIGFVNSGASNSPDLSREELKDLSDHDPSGASIVIFSLAIRPDLHGQGLSRPLLGTFLLRARQLGKQQVLLLCKPPLVAYYERFGFEDAGSSPSTHGGSRWREMRLTL